MFVDAGANIGACLVPLAARDDVTMAVGFEPTPKNLLYATNSILANRKVKRVRIALLITTDFYNMCTYITVTTTWFLFDMPSNPLNIM